MTKNNLIATAISICVAFGATSAFAQAGVLPAEIPPLTYKGNTYVDSAGCVFIRAGINGMPTWVPRLHRDKKQVCGYKPTVVAQSGPAAKKPSNVTVIQPTIVADAPAAAPKAPAARVTTTKKPVKTVASIKASTKTAAVAPKVAVAMPKAKQQPQPLAQAAIKVPARQVEPVNGPRQRVGLNAGNPACQGASPLSTRYIRPQSADVPVRCYEPIKADVWTYTRASAKGPGDGVFSNPVGATATTTAIPKGYRAAWNDGRLNPNRGLKKAAPNAAMHQHATTASHGGRYIQIGTFGVPANASRTAAKFQQMGIPVSVRQISRGGRALKSVMAGPFASQAQLQQALGHARAHGFRDAFVIR